MDFAFTTEQKLFARTVAEFAAQHITPRITEMEATHRIPDDIYRAMAQQGLFGLRYPEAMGGQGGDHMLFAIMVEELAYSYLSTAATAMMQGLMGTHFIQAHGTPEQIERTVIPTLKGDQQGTMCMTEPVGGTDLGALQTTAVREGDLWVLNGSKTWITNAEQADYFTVAAKTDPEAGFKGVDLFLVEKDNPGLRVGKKIEKLTGVAAPSSELSLKDCRLPPEALLGGEPSSGLRLLKPILGPIRIHTGALAVGLARAARDDALAYAKQRQAFGRPIVKFQAMAHKLAQMTIEIEAARLLVYQGAWLLDRGKEHTLQAAAAKHFATETAINCAEQAGRIFGALGVSLELGPQRYLRDARWFLYGGGTQSINLDIIAGQLQR